MPKNMVEGKMTAGDKNNNFDSGKKREKEKKEKKNGTNSLKFASLLWVINS